MIRDSARQLSRDYLAGRVQRDFREQSSDREIMAKMGKMGLLGPTTPAILVNAHLAPEIPYVR
jgi:glutaryl-CoA dehydrogenase